VNSQYIGINPKVMILHRNNQVFAGQLSSTSRPVPLQEPDIILLSLFIGESNLESITKRFNTNPFVKILLPDLPPNAIEQRVQQFIQYGLLIRNRTEFTPAAIDIRTPELPDGTNQNFPEGMIRIAANLALIPCEKGFMAWSPYNNSYYFFDLDLLLTLLVCTRFKNIREMLDNKPAYITREQLEKNIGCLLVNRFVFLDHQQNPAKTQAMSDSQTGVKQVTIPTGRRWQDMSKDPRIPVYFVPHMENHFPLALGLIYSSIATYNNGSLLDKFQLIPIEYLSPDAFVNGPYRKFGKGVWLFSNYIWSVDTNLQISEFAKGHSKGNITIHGGPSTPDYREKCHEFFADNKSVDIAVHGEGESAIQGILDSLFKSDAGNIVLNEDSLTKVEGISYRNRNSLADTIVSTEQKARLKKPDLIPSPYLQGYFNSFSANVEAAIIETNRGCPFGCTFCDWGSATNQKVRKYDLNRVKDEIEWSAKNNIKVLWIADANYGLYDRDIEIASFIIDIKKKYNFPQEVVVNYTKNTTWRLTEIIKIFTEGGIISQGIISIQTMDEKTLEVINRKNIKLDKYEELSNIFKNLNLPLSTDLMMGLPGITFDAFKKDLQYYFDSDVSVKAYPTQLLPNSPMADPEYIRKYQIKTDDNDFLISTYSYSKEELDEMKNLYKAYTVADGYSLLRYILRYLQ